MDRIDLEVSSLQINSIEKLNSFEGKFPVVKFCLSLVDVLNIPIYAKGLANGSIWFDWSSLGTEIKRDERHFSKFNDLPKVILKSLSEREEEIREFILGLTTNVNSQEFTPKSWEGKLRIPVEFVRIARIFKQSAVGVLATIELGHYLSLENVRILRRFKSGEVHLGDSGRVVDNKLRLAITELLASPGIRDRILSFSVSGSSADEIYGTLKADDCEIEKFPSLEFV